LGEQFRSHRHRLAQGKPQDPQGREGSGKGWQWERLPELLDLRGLVILPELASLLEQAILPELASLLEQVILPGLASLLEVQLFRLEVQVILPGLASLLDLLEVQLFRLAERYRQPGATRRTHILPEQQPELRDLALSHTRSGHIRQRPC
jgi:hypothetical protein